jgi:hypothetical protein
VADYIGTKNDIWMPFRKLGGVDDDIYDVEY